MMDGPTDEMFNEVLLVLTEAAIIAEAELAASPAAAVSLQDQTDASCADLRNLIGIPSEEVVSSTSLDPRVKAELTARHHLATADLDRCPHVAASAGPIATISALDLGIQACLDCAGHFIDAIIATTKFWRCGWCARRRPSKYFGVSMGPTMMMGSACAECQAAIEKAVGDARG